MIRARSTSRAGAVLVRASSSTAFCSSAVRARSTTLAGMGGPPYESHPSSPANHLPDAPLSMGGSGGSAAHPRPPHSARDPLAIDTEHDPAVGGEAPAHPGVLFRREL